MRPGLPLSTDRSYYAGLLTILTRHVVVVFRSKFPALFPRPEVARVAGSSVDLAWC